MKTLIRRENDTTIIEFKGKIDMETNEKFIQKIPSLHLDTKKFIFSFEGLEFVGSSGIGTLINALKEFHSNVEVKARYCHVSNEFQRMIQAFDSDDTFEIDTDLKASRHVLDQ